MKFKLVEQHSYWWPVTVSVPHPERPGKFDTQKFDVKFKALPKSETDTMRDDFNKLESEEDRLKHQDDVLHRVCCDWRGVEGDDGSEVEFTDDNFAKAMEWSWFRTGLYLALAASLAGDQARKGN